MPCRGLTRVKKTLVLAAFLAGPVFAAESEPAKPPLAVEHPPKTVLDNLPVLIDDGVSREERRTGEKSGPIERTLGETVRPAASTGLAVAGMVATFPTPASIGFGIVAAVNAYQLFRKKRRKRR